MAATATAETPNGLAPRLPNPAPRSIWSVRDGKLVLSFHPGQAQAWNSKARFTFMLAGAQSGKCVIIGTKVLMADGSTKPIEQVCSGDVVLSLGDDLKLTRNTVSASFSTGVQQAFRVVTATGRSITVTAEHPLYSPEGWKPSGEFALGDCIGVPRADRIGVPRADNATLGTQAVRDIARHNIARHNGKDSIPNFPLDACWERMGKRAHNKPWADSCGYDLLNACRSNPVARGSAQEIANHFGIGAREAFSDIYWDTVERIEPLGEKPMWDITVENGHNYIADDVFAHNTSFIPWLLDKVIQETADPAGGDNDYIALTSSYDLFKLKFMPEIRNTFEEVRESGRYWNGNRIIELRDPTTGKFWANRADDRMWGRIILRSAASGGGLESTTARGAVMDECVAPETIIATEIGPVPISEIVQNHLPLKVWSFDTDRLVWELQPIIRWISLPQREELLAIGPLRITGNHKVWTQEGYLKSSQILSAIRYNKKAEGVKVYELQAVPEGIDGASDSILHNKMCCAVELRSTRIFAGNEREVLPYVCRSQVQGGTVRTYEEEVFRPVEASVGPERRRGDKSPGVWARSTVGVSQACQAVAVANRGQWTSPQLEAGEVGRCLGLGKRVCCCHRRRMDPALLRDRRCGAKPQDRYRGGQRCQSEEADLVRAEWVDASALLQPHGRDLDGGVSSNGRVYNLEVAGNHNYVADGILVSNCGQREFELTTFEAVLRRLSLHQGRIYGGTTLYDLGWLKTEVWDRFQRVGTDHEKPGDSDFNVVNFDSTDNPAFPLEEFERARQSMPEWRFNMFYRGLFTRPAGQIYDCFLDKDVDEGGHRMRPRAVPPHWHRVAGIDFGVVHTCVGLYAVEEDEGGYPTGRLILRQTYFAGGRGATEHVGKLLEIEPNLALVAGGAPSEDNWRQAYLWAGIPVYQPTVADVEVGIDRVYGATKAGNLLVFDTEREYIKQKAAYSRELDGTGEPTDKIKDKATYHYCDSERYLAILMFPIRSFLPFEPRRHLLVGKWGSAQLPRWWRRFGGLRYREGEPAAFVLCCVDDKGSQFVEGEITLTGLKPADMAERIATLIKVRGVPTGQLKGVRIGCNTEMFTPPQTFGAITGAAIVETFRARGLSCVEAAADGVNEWSALKALMAKPSGLRVQRPRCPFTALTLPLLVNDAGTLDTPDPRGPISAGQALCYALMTRPANSRKADPASDLANQAHLPHALRTEQKVGGAYE